MDSGMKPKSRLERAGGNYIAALFLFIDDSSLSPTVKKVLKGAVYTIIAIFLACALLWPFFMPYLKH